MDSVLRFLNTSFGVYKIKNIYIEPTYWMAGAIVLLIFMLLFTLARIRYLYVHWSLGKSSVAMVLWGFVLALIVEGFLILSGRTLFTELLGWKNAPKPISTVLDITRNRLVNVLGITDEIPDTYAEESPNTESVVGGYQSLSGEDAETVRNLICQPEE